MLAPKKKSLVVIHPGSSLDIKNWPLDRYQELAYHLLTSENCGVVWILGESEAHIVDQIHVDQIVAPLMSVYQLSALCTKASVIVGSDSGPLHLAAALQVPTIALFGPSDQRIFKPFCNRSITVNHEVLCSPCFKPFETKLTCRMGSHECMKLIAVEAVLDAIRSILSAKQEKGTTLNS